MKNWKYLMPMAVAIGFWACGDENNTAATECVTEQCLIEKYGAFNADSANAANQQNPNGDSIPSVLDPNNPLDPPPVDPNNPWPNFPRTLKTTSSHEEGCVRRWNINTLEFIGKDGKLTGVKVQEKGKEPEIIKAELVLLAMGFLRPEHPEYPEKVFVCGDAANGASLVVRAMASGKNIAKQVDKFLSE